MPCHKLCDRAELEFVGPRSLSLSKCSRHGVGMHVDSCALIAVACMLMRHDVTMFWAS
jgi:hypothetical protein